MTATAATLPLSDPLARGLHPGRSLTMALLRLTVLLGVSAAYDLAVTSSSADSLGAGLLSFAIMATLFFLWAFFDGWLRPLRTSAVAWTLVAVFFTVLSPLPRTLTAAPDEGGWTGLGDYLAFVADGAEFTLALVAVPAAVALLLGYGVRLLTRRAARPPR